MHRSLKLMLPLSAFVLVAGVATTARGAAPETRPMTSQKPALLAAHKEFALQAGRGGLAEVEIARVVVTRATRPEVRDFAQRLIDDHSRANQELENLANQKSITLPTTLDPAQQNLLDRMKTMGGAALDDTYLKEMIKDHEADSHLFERGQNAQDPDLKAFAQRTLPTIQQHLEMAKRLAEATSSKGASR